MSNRSLFRASFRPRVYSGRSRIAVFGQVRVGTRAVSAHSANGCPCKWGGIFLPFRIGRYPRCGPENDSGRASAMVVRAEGRHFPAVLGKGGICSADRRTIRAVPVRWLSVRRGGIFLPCWVRAVSAVRTGERFGPCQCDGYLCRGTSRVGSFCEWLSLLTRMGSKCFRDEFRFKPESIPMVIFSRQVGAPREG